MIKRSIIAVFVSVIAFAGVAQNAYADNCPAGSPCSASMPTVPAIGNPLASTNTSAPASSTTTTPAATTQVIATTTTQQSSTSNTPSISVPTVPVQQGNVQVPTIAVPTIKAPSAVTENNGVTAQQAPIISVPKMTWDNGSTTPVPAVVAPSPVYPAVSPTPKAGSTSKSTGTPRTASVPDVTVTTSAVYPNSSSGNGSGLPFGYLFYVAVGALAVVGYRAAKERNLSLATLRTNKETTTP